MSTDRIISSLESITGIDGSELRENEELDLLENGILDSLSIVNLVNELRRDATKIIDIKKLTPSDFRTIKALRNTFGD